MVIEYNVRMGDPETEAVMLRVDSDLVALLKAAAEGNLGSLPLNISPKTAVTVMLVSGGYPGDYRKGLDIEIEGEIADGTILFHAGTRRDETGRLMTSGGRVISVSSLGDSIADALAKSYAVADLVKFEGKYLRRDIGRDLIRLCN